MGANGCYIGHERVANWYCMRERFVEATEAYDGGEISAVGGGYTEDRGFGEPCASEFAHTIFIYEDDRYSRTFRAA